MQLQVIFMDKKNSDQEHPDEQTLEIPTKEFLREELAREKARNSFRKALWNVMTVLLVAAAITALVATRLFLLVQIDGNSMEPGLAAGDTIAIHQTKDIEKGDVIGFYYGGRILLKRVIGSAGDQIDIDKDGNVSVNGKIQEEPYVAEKNLGKCEIEFPYEVPEGMVFVLGDNRSVSLDSRIHTIGCVETDQIAGKALFKAWPINRIGIIQ